MTPATLSALFLFAAALLQSFSYLCRKLPAERRPNIYPRNQWAQAGIDLSWICLFGAGIVPAFGLSAWLGAVALIAYFVILPFAFQPSMARLMGFKSLRDYLETVDRG
ncbi:MAG: hypothetical protein C0617_16485 [Desulfuromonas sp.]|uniref:hypothetical protein n=1 Tax=Desulfuromonas sp. TaxID=892 RepID=UPI000CA7C6C5|nr:hypothetical protein [Desulfuromonas sp.]PLX81686.1 MAG: hypothetical protein C0617_16485 [Desulfuromonas sp.]